MTARRGERLTVTPPTWRPDLTDPADLVEEVVRLDGYDRVPSVLPPAPPGSGLTGTQRRRRAVGRALAEAGYVEVLSLPVRRAGARWTRSGCPPTTRAATRCGWPTRCPRRSRCCAPRCCRRCSARCAATSAAASGTWRCSRWAWSSSPRRRRRLRRRRWAWTDRPDRRGVRRRRRGRAGPAVARRRGARRRGRAGRLVGRRAARPAGRTRSRRPGSCSPPAGVARDRVDGTGRRARARGTRAGAPRSSSTAPSSATRASCTRPSARRWSCPRRTCAMELDLDALPLPPVAPGAAGLHVPAGADRRGAGGGRRGAGGRGARRRWSTGAGRAAGVGAAVRRVHRREQLGDGPQVAGVQADVPRPGPHAHRSRRRSPPGTRRWPWPPRASARPCAAPEGGAPS